MSLQIAAPRERGATSQILHIFIGDSTLTGTTQVGKTGLTNASSGLTIAAVLEGSAAATVYSGSSIVTITTLGTWASPGLAKIGFKEYDATNAKGVYELHLPDSLLTGATSRMLRIVVSGVAGTCEEVLQVPLTSAALYNAGALTSVSGSVGSVTGAVGSVTGAVGSVTGAVGSIGTGGITAASLAASSGLAPLASGTASAGSTLSITLAGASATNSLYVGCWVAIVSGTGAGQVRLITGYTGATKVANVHVNWTTDPDNTSGFVVLPATAIATVYGAVGSVDTAVNSVIQLPVTPALQSIYKNTTGQKVLVFLSDNQVGATGGGDDMNATLSKDGGTPAALINPAVEIGSGFYSYTLTQAESNFDVASLTVTGAGGAYVAPIVLIGVPAVSTARLSADGLDDAIIDGTITATQAQRVGLAFMRGEVTVIDNGDGTDTYSYKRDDGTTEAFTVTASRTTGARASGGAVGSGA
jgi:hypothetical protein